MTEKWKAIPGFPCYRVSNLGRVDTSVTWLPAKGRKGARRLTFAEFTRHLVKPYRSHGRYRYTQNYQRVYLWTFHQMRKVKHQRFVHPLVLEAFVGPPPTGFQASHINGNPEDNRLENLRWETAADNQSRKIAHGTSLRGENHFNASLTEADVLKIWQMLRAGIAGARLAEKFGVSKYVISSIRTRKAWSHVTASCAAQNSNSHSKKLSEKDVTEIRKRCSRGEPQVALAREFSVNKTTISSIVRRKNWKSIP